MNRWMDNLKPISRTVIEQAVIETRLQDQKQLAYEQSRQTWRALNSSNNYKESSHA